MILPTCFEVFGTESASSLAQSSSPVNRSQEISAYMVTEKGLDLVHVEKLVPFTIVCTLVLLMVL